MERAENYILRKSLTETTLNSTKTGSAVFLHTHTPLFSIFQVSLFGTRSKSDWQLVFFLLWRYFFPLSVSFFGHEHFWGGPKALVWAMFRPVFFLASFGQPLGLLVFACLKDHFGPLETSSPIHKYPCRLNNLFLQMDPLVEFWILSSTNLQNFTINDSLKCLWS